MVLTLRRDAREAEGRDTRVWCDSPHMFVVHVHDFTDRLKTLRHGMRYDNEIWTRQARAGEQMTKAVWCVPALRVPLVHSLINHFRQRDRELKHFGDGHGQKARSRRSRTRS